MQKFIEILEEIDSKKVFVCESLAEDRELALAFDSYDEKFDIEHTYDSCAIEGSTFTMNDTAKVYNDLLVKDKPFADHLRAIGIKNVLNFIRSADEPFDLNTINEIHKTVFEEGDYMFRGRYRNYPVFITNSSVVTTNPAKIPDKMIELLSQYNEFENHILMNIAKFHPRFEEIHPFVDANGRTGRAIINFQLFCSGYPMINIKNNEKERYYESLEIAHNGDDSAFTELLLDEVNRELDIRIEIIRGGISHKA